MYAIFASLNIEVINNESISVQDYRVDLLVELIDQKKTEIQMFNAQFVAQQAEKLKYQDLVDEANMELEVCFKLDAITVCTSAYVLLVYALTMESPSSCIVLSIVSSIVHKPHLHGSQVL